MGVANLHDQRRIADAGQHCSRAQSSGITPKSALIGFQSGSVVLMHGESYAYGVLQIVSVPRAKDLSELWGLDY